VKHPTRLLCTTCLATHSRALCAHRGELNANCRRPRPLCARLRIIIGGVQVGRRISRASKNYTPSRRRPNVNHRRFPYPPPFRTDAGFSPRRRVTRFDPPKRFLFERTLLFDAVRFSTKFQLHLHTKRRYCSRIERAKNYRAKGIRKYRSFRIAVVYFTVVDRH